MNRRVRRRGGLAGLVAAAGLVVAAVSVATAGPVGTAAGFEDDDGNLAPQAPINFDWNSFAPVIWLPSPSPTPNRQADKVLSGFTFKGLEDWQATTADSGFAGGTKQDDNCASVITAKAPNKDDLKRIYLATKTGADGHTYLELAWVRIPQNTTSASAHVAFEFNKGTAARARHERARQPDGRRHADRVRLRGWLVEPDPHAAAVGHVRRV